MRSSTVNSGCRADSHRMASLPLSGAQAVAIRCRPSARLRPGRPNSVPSRRTTDTFRPGASAGSHAPDGAIAIIGGPVFGFETITMSPWLEMPKRWLLASSRVAVRVASLRRLPAGDRSASGTVRTASIPGVAAATAEREAPASATRRMMASAVSTRPSIRAATVRVSLSMAASIAMSALWRSSQPLRPSAPAISRMMPRIVHFSRDAALADA